MVTFLVAVDQLYQLSFANEQHDYCLLVHLLNSQQLLLWKRFSVIRKDRRKKTSGNLFKSQSIKSLFSCKKTSPQVMDPSFLSLSSSTLPSLSNARLSFSSPPVVFLFSFACE